MVSFHPQRSDRSIEKQRKCYFFVGQNQKYCWSCIDFEQFYVFLFSKFFGYFLIAGSHLFRSEFTTSWQLWRALPVNPAGGFSSLPKGPDRSVSWRSGPGKIWGKPHAQIFHIGKQQHLGSVAKSGSPFTESRKPISAAPPERVFRKNCVINLVKFWPIAGYILRQRHPENCEVLQRSDFAQVSFENR